MTNIRTRIPFEDLPSTRRLVALCQVGPPTFHVPALPGWPTPACQTTILAPRVGGFGFRCQSIPLWTTHWCPSFSLPRRTFTSRGRRWVGWGSAGAAPPSSRPAAGLAVAHSRPTHGHLPGCLLGLLAVALECLPSSLPMALPDSTLPCLLPACRGSWPLRRSCTSLSSPSIGCPRSCLS